MTLVLTVNPYRGVRETIRRPILLPVIITPLFGLGILLIAGRLASLLIVVYGTKRELIALFLSTTLISIIFWQVLLIYLLGSFIAAYLKRK